MKCADLVQIYDHLIATPLLQPLYGDSGFFNVGYWFDDTQSQEDACRNLIETMMGMLPEKRGIIIDLACGLGATSRHLLRYYSAENILATNLSTNQLRQSRLKAPACRYAAMDATALGLATSSVDSILCVEAAFHFDTRERFFAEAFRVLRPGGYLVLADVIFGNPHWIGAWTVPASNHLTDIEDYKEVYRHAGFHGLQCIDATEPCWIRFCRHLLRWTNIRFRSLEIDRETSAQLRRVAYGMMEAEASYLLVSLRKS